MIDTIAKRLRAGREDRGMTQKELSDLLGFKDRQTVGAIEAGVRKMSADELLLAIKVLGRDLEYFTDAFRLDGEGSFSWRAAPAQAERLAEFESRASRWLALYRHLASDETPGTAPMALQLTSRSSYEEAHRAAEWLVDEWDLGEIPAKRLERAIGARLRALVLAFDAPEGISGAAFRMPELSAILINRRESAGRRNFNLAHELFHLLTWDTIRPVYREGDETLDARSRPEQLANCFASALLMPRETVLHLRDRMLQQATAPEPQWWVAHAAEALQVSPAALQWRCVQLGVLKKSDVVDIRETDAEAMNRPAMPRRMGFSFVASLRSGLDAGKVSVRRASSLLGMTIDELADLFCEHELEVPFDL